MKTGNVIGIVVGLGLLGVAAFIFLRKPPEQKPDPLSNILSAAPGAIEGVGNVAASAGNAGEKIIKSGIGLAVAPTKAIVSGAKDIISSLKFW